MGNNQTKSDNSSEQDKLMDDIKAKVSKASKSLDIGEKISTAYQLIQDLQNYTDGQMPQALMKRVKFTNENIHKFLRDVAAYVTDFAPEYETLRELQAEWSAEEMADKTKKYLFSGDPPLIKGIVKRTKNFTDTMNSLIMVIHKQRDQYISPLILLMSFTGCG